MRIRERAASLLAFRVVPTTFVFLFIYAAIYLSVLITYELPTPPSSNKQGGLDLDAAYADLHQIAGLAHPYNSHQNDVVRQHVLDRVTQFAKGSSFVHVDDDLSSNTTFARSGMAAYFEGSNVLVKIDGHDSSLDGVLFSAHFDSVSTAPGATDDGMGVATMLQLVHYFSQHQPKRTVVFNINNGEEDGLYGAVAFLEHPWFNLTKNFLNLEGAGAGGRPMLLRATSTDVARAFSHASHPHGVVASSDAFSRGVVKSGTDYTIYTAASLGGLDLAFYRQRSKYHTKRDSIPSLGGKAALWNMMESTLQAGKVFVEKDISEGSNTPVYFDLFGESLVVSSLKTYYILNIVLLVLGPFIVGGTVFFTHRKGRLYWTGRCWGRTPAAVVFSAGLAVVLAFLYSRLNPLIVYSSSASVFISCLALSYIAFYVVLETFSYFLPVPQLRSVIFLETYVLWWILLVFDTAIIGSKQIGGLYFITFFHISTLLALLVALLELFELPALTRTHHHLNEHGDDAEGAASTERTPLIGQNGRTIKEEEVDEENQIGLWLLQFLLVVPFPVILTTQMAVLLLNALNQTLVDGSPAFPVYLGASLIAVLSFLPVLPFVHKLHRSIAYIAVLVFAITLLYNVFAFPFSENSPLKIFFQQIIDLDTGVNDVILTGVNPWLSRSVVAELPSSWGDEAHVNCSGVDPLSKVPNCAWHGIPPSVAPGNSTTWMSVTTSKESPGVGTIVLSGKDTRNCRLYFDNEVTTVSVNGSSGLVQPLFPIPQEGVKELRLWSRSWERTFEVSVVWKEGDKPLRGRAACEWAEAAGVSALEEVVNFLPEWVLVTKRTDGLLEGWKSFEIK